MNRFVKSTFDDLKREEGNFRDAVTSALADYRRTMSRATAESKQFKDEAAYLNDKKATAAQKARVEIQLATNAFTAALNAARKSLQDDLDQHLTTRPGAAFLDALRLYHDFNITPSHAEIKALMALNGGNTLGYRAINQVLKATHSEYTIDAPDSAAFEADLAALEKLSYGNFKYEPEGFHHEMTEVYGGTPELRLRDDGSTFDAGDRWSNTSLLMATTMYKRDIGAIDAMADRWNSTVLPSLRHLEAYQDNEETGETAAMQMAKDIKATATAPEIERTATGAVAAVAMAKEIGQIRAKGWQGAIDAIGKAKIQ